MWSMFTCLFIYILRRGFSCNTALLVLIRPYNSRAGQYINVVGTFRIPDFPIRNRIILVKTKKENDILAK